LAIARPAATQAAALRIMHPDQYQEGMQTFMRLGKLASMKRLPRMGEVLELWASVFTALTIISNRETPYHRDPLSRPQWFDILVSIGSHVNTYMRMPSLQLELKYDSGTMVAFSGRLVRHGVHQVKGDRIAWAWYMRDAVHHYAGVPRRGWATRTVGENE
jgi:hypothetical protein